MRVAIIGSGLTAISVAKRLVTRNIKPVILDAGEEIENDKASLASRLSEIEPKNWNVEDRTTLASNPTGHGGMAIPQKLLFGSDFFYGQSNDHAPLQGHGPLPPFSYARGGFSVGWGASVLTPDQCDIEDWPITLDNLADHFESVLATLPLSANDDELTARFPLYKENYSTLKLTAGNAAMLQDLRRSGLLKSDDFLFGQARLLVRSQTLGDKPGCKYCGHCMSGCVYGCIYKSNDDLDHLASAGKIDYTGQAWVQHLEEKNNKVDISYVNRLGDQQTMSVDKVFLAAGAVNSTRIILKSKKLYDHKVYLRSSSSFVLPMLRAKHAPVDWPNINTQPGLFLEYKVPGLSNHWIHTQLSTPNEMVFEKLNLHHTSNSLIQKLKRRILGHLVIAFCNLHSNHGYGYELSLKKGDGNSNDLLMYDRQCSIQSDKDNKRAINHLLRIGWKFGCIALTPTALNFTSGFHVGGTLPMKQSPQKETETDLLGRPGSMKNVHVVDSSVFPSLPGTTIGLLAMANADRIASEVLLK
jgi:choline dehydrogenase-like flavoprotein